MEVRPAFGVQYKNDGGKTVEMLIEKITQLLRKSAKEDLELFLIFIDTYLRRKK